MSAHEITCSLSFSATQLVDLDDFVEMTQQYAQGIVPSASQNDNQVTAKTESPTTQDSGAEVKQPNDKK